MGALEINRGGGVGTIPEARKERGKLGIATRRQEP